MAQTTFEISTDETLKKEFESLCDEFGMSATTAFNIFARAVVREGKFPFEIPLELIRADAKNAFQQMRDIAAKNNLQDMTLEEINEEITASQS